MKGRRSWLFVPGDSERKLAKGPSTGADILILDVEDSVSPARKPVARKMIAEYLGSAARDGAPLWVRINGLHTPDWRDDVEAAMAGAADGIVLPKPRSTADVFAVAELMDRLEDPGARRAGRDPCAGRRDRPRPDVAARVPAWITQADRAELGLGGPGDRRGRTAPPP